MNLINCFSSIKVLSIFSIISCYTISISTGADEEAVETEQTELGVNNKTINVSETTTETPVVCCWRRSPAKRLSTTENSTQVAAEDKNANGTKDHLQCEIPQRTNNSDTGI